MSKSFTINFKCPNCGGKNIEEIVYSDYTSTRLANVAREEDDGISFEYGKTIAGGDTHSSKYCCTGCGKELTTEDDCVPAALFNWLRENDMLLEDDEPLMPKVGDSCLTVGCGGILGAVEGVVTCPACGLSWGDEDDSQN